MRAENPSRTPAQDALRAIRTSVPEHPAWPFRPSTVPIPSSPNSVPSLSQRATHFRRGETCTPRTTEKRKGGGAAGSEERRPEVKRGGPGRQPAYGVRGLGNVAPRSRDCWVAGLSRSVPIADVLTLPSKTRKLKLQG